MRYLFEDNNIRLTVLLLLIGAGLAGLIFWFFTSLTLDLSIGGGMWFFFLFFFLLLFWLVITFIGLARLRPEYSYIKWLFLAITVALIMIIVALGIQHRPFSADNLKFKLGTVPIFDLGNSGAEDEDKVLADLSDVVPDVEVDLRSFLPPSLAQGDCGNCWAMAPAMSMSARRIMRDGRKVAGEYTCPTGGSDVKDWYVSPQFITDADDSSIGQSNPYGKCDGNQQIKAYKIVRDTGGAPDIECVPLQTPHTPNCSCGYQGHQAFNRNICALAGEQVATTCENGALIQDEQKTRISAYRVVRGERQIEQEITKHGPVVCYVNYYEKSDGSGCAWSLRGIKSIFGQYSNYISDSFVARPSQDGNEYTKGNILTANAQSGHSLVISGYGEVNGVKYWQATNSWGTSWGFNGHVKIEKGIDAWNIESECVGATLA
jgi:hypothetical protein